MADSCTYADLRFMKATPPLKECGTLGPDPEAFSTVYMNAGEHTYANVKNSEGGSQDRASSRHTGREPGKSHGGISFSKHIALILAVSFLITLVTCIVLGVQLFQISKDRDTLESNLLQKIQMQNKSLENIEKRSKETELKLEEARDNLEDIQEKVDIFNSSLHSTKKEMEQREQKLTECQTTVTATQGRLTNSEDTLKGIKQFFTDHEEAESCQRGWHLLAGSCFFFSEITKTMKKSQEECTSRAGWLIGSRVQDPAVKEFMNNGQRKEYWIGLRTKGWMEKNWEDTRLSNLDLNEYGVCGVMYSDLGRLEQFYCTSRWEKLFICEKNPKKITLKNGIPAVPQTKP